jgi:thymidylate synthase
MKQLNELSSATASWKVLLHLLSQKGQEVSPRGIATKEMLAYTSIVPMTFPIVVSKKRALSYKFMAAEAYWILTGDNRLSTISPYSKKIADFSDDGVFFKGAYGPKVVDQLPYVIETLANDLHSRQAVLTIWRERPGKSKDIPCTIALQFIIRDGKLHTIATMRSSDAWLGFPYDIFNFSMISWYVISVLKTKYSLKLKPGNLHLTAGSQHLYETNFEKSQLCIVEDFDLHMAEDFDVLEYGETLRQSPEIFMNWLESARESGVLRAFGLEEA